MGGTAIRRVSIGGRVEVGAGCPPVLIAGPCGLESEGLALEVAAFLSGIAARLSLPVVFKGSFDKANRSSRDSYRGPGEVEGLRILDRVRERHGLPVTTDVHDPAQARRVASRVDLLQIPAFLCRQTDLLVAAGETGVAVNIKKGQFLSPAEMSRVVEKATKMGGGKILLTERGTTFGYNNLVADMRSIPIMQRTGCPVIFDATHSVQLPGGGGDKSAGEREFAPVLARLTSAGS